MSRKANENGMGNEPGAATGLPQAPFEVVPVHGAEALEQLTQLRANSSGAVPVVLGGREEFRRVIELMSMSEESYEEILAAGQRVDVAKWLQDRLESDPELYRTEGPDSDSVDPIEPLTVAYDILSGKPKAEVFIGLIPVSQPWQVPAYLRSGGWNECPDAAVHVAFFKRWYEQYGAVVASVAQDVIEFTVERPPQTRQDALRLAREQFVYCSDIVHQGVGTVNNLASALVGSHNWYFWWD